MGYSMKQAYNGWAALAAAVLAGCSSTSKQAAQERAQESEAAFAENQRISANVRQTFAITQRQPQGHAKIQTRFQPLNTPIAQAPVPFELDPREYAPDSKPIAPPQIRPIAATVAATSRTPLLAAPISSAPNSAVAPPRAFPTLTIASADNDPVSTLPAPIDLPDTQVVKTTSAPAAAAPAPKNPAHTIGTPQIGSGLTIDADGKLKSFTLRRPPSAAFLAATETFRSVTIDRLGHVIAWEPITGPTRASGLIRRRINPDPKFPYVELVAEPNPNARSESAHPGLVFTPLAGGSLVYTCE